MSGHGTSTHASSRNDRMAMRLRALADELDRRSDDADRSGNPRLSTSLAVDARSARRTAELLEGGPEGVRDWFVREAR